MSQNEIATALAYWEERFLKSGEQFDTRKQANAIVALCFRNTKLEDFHAGGYISDDEMKSLSIETSARIEYLMVSKLFDAMSPMEIFSFAFEVSYKIHVKKNLGKSMWKALGREAEANLATIQFLKANEALAYKAKLLGIWAIYAQYYNEDIKFDGHGLSADPNTIAVGNQRAGPMTP
jgi:hypothetical protein